MNAKPGPGNHGNDVKKIAQISIVPMMLEVVCRSTGMGFSAIARVTDDKWIACSVRDEINFGLVPGGELKLETTICNEIRDSRKPVVIDHVEKDPLFATHHTPAMYGFQSYISFPIILSTGEFFGTLCAIDPRPALISDTKTMGMFSLFAQLIAFHLQAADELEKSQADLSHATEEKKKYEHITYHSLREPVRKICYFSDELTEMTAEADRELIKKKAHDINRFATELATKLKRVEHGPANEEG